MNGKDEISLIIKDIEKNEIILSLNVFKNSKILLIKQLIIEKIKNIKNINDIILYYNNNICNDDMNINDIYKKDKEIILFVKIKIKSKNENKEINPYKQKLIDFYKKYAPNKIKNVDNILLKYKNHEYKLFNSLYEVYNVDMSEYDFCNTNFNPLKSLYSDIILPYPNIKPLDNISKCRYLLPETDPEYIPLNYLNKPKKEIKVKENINVLTKITGI